MKTRITSLAACLCVLSAVAVFLAWRTDTSFNHELALQIRQVLNSEPPHELILSNATPFDWDQVCIFGPYTSQEDVIAHVGSNCDRSAAARIPSDDGNCLLVFKNGEEVVFHTLFPRGDGDFSEVSEQPICLSRDQALFEVRVEEQGKGEPWINLELVQSN